MKKKEIKLIIEETLQEYRLDEIVQHLINQNSLNDLLLAFSNICVKESNLNEDGSKKYEYWRNKAFYFHNAITDDKASVLPKKVRKVKKEEDE